MKNAYFLFQVAFVLESKVAHVFALKYLLHKRKCKFLVIFPFSLTLLAFVSLSKGRGQFWGLALLLHVVTEPLISQIFFIKHRLLQIVMAKKDISC